MVETITSIATSKIGISVISVIATGIVSCIFYYVRLRSKQKVRFKEVIGEKIAESLLNARKICIEASGIGRYGIEDDLESGEVIKAFDLGIYPTIMNDADRLSKFIEQIRLARENDEPNLSRAAAAHLYYIQNYLLEMTSYIKSIGMIDSLPQMGCIFIVDIQKWQHSFDKRLTKDINKHAVKIKLHRGALWEMAKTKMHKKLYNKSILVLLQSEEGLNEEDQATRTEILNLVQAFRDGAI